MGWPRMLTAVANHPAIRHLLRVPTTAERLANGHRNGGVWVVFHRARPSALQCPSLCH